MNYKAVFLDIDGTIVNTEHKIPESTKEAVRLLKQNGIDVLIATGRSVFETVHITKELGIESSITFNGSYVLYKGKEILKRTFPHQEVIDLYNEAQKKPEVAVGCHGLEYAFYSNPNHPIIKKSNEKFDFKDFKIKDSIEEIGDIYKMIVFSKDENEVKHYRSKFSNFRFTPWNSHVSYDVNPSEGSKVVGIQAVIDYLQIPREEIVAFGDGLNDTEMLSFAGMGVAMGNSHAGLIPYADFQTKHVNEDGIYYGLKKLGLI